MTELSQDLISEIKKLTRWHRDLLTQYKDLAERVETSLDKQDALAEVLREWTEEASRSLDDIEKLLLLERTGNQQTPQADRVKGRIQTRQDKKYLQEELAIQWKNLNRKNQQAAQYGTRMNWPTHIANEIEALEAEVNRLQQELEDLK